MSEQHVFRIARDDDLEEGIAQALAEIDPEHLDDLVIQAHGQDEHHETFRRMLTEFAADHARRLLEDEEEGVYFFLPLRLH